MFCPKGATLTRPYRHNSLADKRVPRAGSESRPMTIRPPAGADALRTGIWLLDRGLWPVVISGPDDSRASSPGKSPLRREWGLKKPSVEKLRAIYRWYPAAGIGLLLGPRGKVVDLEVDDPERAASFLERLFPSGLPKTLGWRSARGEHRLFLWDSRLSELAATAVVTFAGGAVELRIGGVEKQVAAVCPPSLGTDGVPRRWNGIWRILPIPEAVISELERLSHDRVSRARVSPDPGPIHRTIATRICARSRDRDRERGRCGDEEPDARIAPRSIWVSSSPRDFSRDEVEAALRDAAFAAGLHEERSSPP